MRNGAEDGETSGGAGTFDDETALGYLTTAGVRWSRDRQIDAASWKT